MNPDAKPLISVVVPSFRMARFLPAMLDSTLGQDYRPLEIIVADGGSDDGTVEVLRGYAERFPELRWISEKDKGPADAVNKGLRMARGEYIAIQNADDVFLPDALTAAAAVLQQNPQASFVYGDLEGLDEQGRTTYTRRFPDFSWEAFFAWSCTLAQSSILIRREHLLAIGGWNAAYYSCDLDCWLRLALRAPPVHIARTLSGWRRYAAQRTRPDQYGKIWDGYWRMVNDCPELKDAPPRLRRLARASCHLLALRFHPTREPWAIRGHALRGLALHPTAWRYQPAERFTRLIPGRAFLRRLFRRADGANP